MAQFNIDTLTQMSLHEEVILKIHYLSAFTLQFDKVMLTALANLEKMTQCAPDRLIDSISAAYLTNRATNRQDFTMGQNAIKHSDMMWEMTYLLAYFLMNEDEVWKNTLLPWMKGKEKHSVIIEEMNKGEKLIDAFFDRRATLKNEIDAKAINETALQPQSPSFYIAEGRKTDAMKIFSYMFDEGIFTGADGQPLNRQKKSFMQAIAQFFGSDFDNYAQVINHAAQEPNFPLVFENMLNKANDKYAYSK